MTQPDASRSGTFAVGGDILINRLGFSVTNATTGVAVEASAVCFARGTRIATPAGYVAVEELAPGQLVLTADGTAEEIQWVGRRRISCRKHPEPRKAWPVRINKG